MTLNQVINFCNYYIHKQSDDSYKLFVQKMRMTLQQINLLKLNANYKISTIDGNLIFANPANDKDKVTIAFGGLKDLIEEMPEEIQTYD